MPERPEDPPPEAAGVLPLAQAFRDYADPKLVKQYRLAKEQLERKGHWHYVGNRDNPGGYVLSEFDGLGRALLKESRELIARIEAGFMGKLRRGKLTAWAREGSPLAPWREIPASAWSTLRLDDVVKGTVKGPGTALFDVRVGPRLARPSRSPRRPCPPPARRAGRRTCIWSRWSSSGGRRRVSSNRPSPASRRRSPLGSRPIIRTSSR